MIEKVGGLTFQDGVLVSDFDIGLEIEKRGGWKEIIKECERHNAFMRLSDDSYAAYLEVLGKVEND